MSDTKVNDKSLDSIIGDMVSVVTNSKEEIFELGEETRNQEEALREEIDQIKKEVTQTIEENDRLEKKMKLARKRLSEVSKNFDQFTEQEVRKVYNSTHEIQTQLIVTRQKEVQLIKRRDEVEARLKSLGKSIERAENIMSKINVILSYLQEDFRDVNKTLTAAKEKHEFGLQIIDAQEEERRKLSREIHDGPAQMLANVLIRSDIVGKTFRERGVDEALGEVKEVKEMVRSALYEVRRIIYDLRPMALDDLGLIPTLRKYLGTTEDYHDTRIEFLPKGKEKRYTHKFEAAVFRLVQESVQNAVKHSDASLIRVIYEETSTHLNVHIIDNGKGFDTSEKKAGSFGLVGMRERIEMLEGEIQIESNADQGTKVKISLPSVY
ncbi:histidine kinase [Halalkalibacillus sediminis]|uniref:Signal transduction histidine-protein kinase/phosphatase DegS n=1 Tax=Halalkalibacillus sediminis TaxID=2018042 RepID=A0A2I0QUK2_9BACI|nr:sensor histidine kinase [Halalkalibacillus sediminis]PKR77974.1 histidine kinase [Halalkalibacillus sediminis]